MKTKEEIVSEVTLRHYRDKPNGTMAAIYFDAMEEYAEQFKQQVPQFKVILPQKKFPMFKGGLTRYQEGYNDALNDIKSINPTIKFE